MLKSRQNRISNRLSSALEPGESIRSITVAEAGPAVLTDRRLLLLAADGGIQQDLPLTSVSAGPIIPGRFRSGQVELKTGDRSVGRIRGKQADLTAAIALISAAVAPPAEPVAAAAPIEPEPIEPAPVKVLPPTAPLTKPAASEPAPVKATRKAAAKKAPAKATAAKKATKAAPAKKAPAKRAQKAAPVAETLPTPVPAEVTPPAEPVAPAVEPAIAPAPTVAPAASAPAPGDVRAWAKANGITVGDRGRIPASTIAAYQAAQADPSAG